ITPVLRGSCQMQGPVDEAYCKIQTNMVLSQDEKGLSRHSSSQKFLMRAESGTCNVCSAPCSSCLHITRTLMDSKTDECSDETCEGNSGSQYSVNDVVPVKSTACDSGRNTASETSNLVSVNSNHDSFSENVESKACLRNCDVSGSYEDDEMHQTFSSHQRGSTNRLEVQKVVEGHGDSVSCVSGGNHANKLASYVSGNVVRKNVPHSSVSAELSSHKADLIDSSKDRSEGDSSKVLMACSCPYSGKSHSCNPNVRDLEEDLCSQIPVELPEFSKEHLNSSLTKEAASDMVCGQGSASYTCGGMDDGGLVSGNSAASDKICLDFEAETELETDKGSGDPSAVNSSKQIEEIKIKESCGLPYPRETSLESQPVEDSDGSDVVEHDVKVCDICGDAGREDLLAICSSCSDGAEHTYCMREMMDKVPEGDWLCEECKIDEEIKKLKQDKPVTVDGNDKNQSSGEATALNTNLFVKLDKKDSDVEGNKTNKDILSEKASNKRYAESIEVVSTVKRQVLEPTLGSPKTSSPSRIAALSHDSSFGSQDKGKLKPAHQLSSGTCITADTSKAAFSPAGPRLQTPRGTLLKSNSFNSINAKPKVKLVDEVLQKQKSAREPASLDMKECSARLIGKSMSFKSAIPGRLNPLESKVKMLSPNFSHGQDLKGLRQAKEWNLPERKNPFKWERPLVGSTTGNTPVSMLKGDKKVSSYGESYLHPSVSNNSELKSVQADTKSSTLSKSTSHVARRGPEIPVPSGENKRQSCLPGVVGASSTNGISSCAEQKPNQTNLLCDLSTSSFTVEGTLNNANEGQPDVLPRPRGSTNPGERIKESSNNHSRPSMTTGGSVHCQKCKEIGHSAQFCTVGSPRSLLGDASAARSSREVMDKGNKLKAAIEAAMLKKPGIYRKKMPDQSDDLSVSNTCLNGEMRPQDQISTSVNTRNSCSGDEVHERQAVQQNFTAESCKQTTFNNMKHLPALPYESASLKTGDVSPTNPSDWKPFIRDLPNHASAVVSVFLKMSIIPEHEYIWQGGFEVQRSGKCSDLHDGIQAHLSTCASRKVLEAVNKFPSKVLLDEVPRLSTWPLQFQEIGVREDNIALYFFAKDLESYEKSYKSLLETMMKGDLALKGNFDGVELLIFPSNHLPEKSQRWNMLYFLWGVFRGKTVNCLQDVSVSPSICSLRPIYGDLPTCSKACNVALGSEHPASMDSPCLSSETINEDCDINASSLDLQGQRIQANAGQQNCRLDATSSPLISPQEENVDPECKLDVKPHLSVQAAGTIGGFKKSEEMPMYLGNAPEHQQISSCSFKIGGGENCSKKEEVTYEGTLMEEEGYLDAKTGMQKHNMMEDRTMKELRNWQQHTQVKRLHEESTSAWVVSQASAGPSINSELLDEGCASKKQKTGHSGSYVCSSSSNTSSLRESFASGTHDIGTSSLMIKKETGKEACDEREIFRNDIGTAERYFFPVDPHPANNFSLGCNSIPLKVCLSEDDDRHLPDGAPNLELALGADMKPSKHGTILPFLAGKVNLKGGQVQPLERAAIKEEEEEEEEDASACLSLSLSFPFPDKEQSKDRVSEVNTSLLLFEGLSKE
ncbi:hypothetical protein U1Q18_004975, partial [Sarracenia purpurea var. burkii]